MVYFTTYTQPPHTMHIPASVPEAVTCLQLGMLYNCTTIAEHPMVRTGTAQRRGRMQAKKTQAELPTIPDGYTHANNKNYSLCKEDTMLEDVWLLCSRPAVEPEAGSRADHPAG